MSLQREIKSSRDCVTHCESDEIFMLLNTLTNGSVVQKEQTCPLMLSADFLQYVGGEN